MLPKLQKLATYRPPASVLRVARLLKFGPALLVVALIVFIATYLSSHSVALLNPQGVVAAKERNLMLFALGLSVLVVVPVFILLFGFAWRYREKNEHATYSPNLDGSRKAETVWWLVPTLLILVLSVVTWQSSHALDPARALVSNRQPLQVQVVALDWKWLFIYPDSGIATVNQLYIPTDTPVAFTLTSDAPMNSFWIPQLGGQIYTMPGMTTQLQLQASKAGDYRGQSANISGEGFARMHFMTHAVSTQAFQKWQRTALQTDRYLTSDDYTVLAKPNVPEKPITYASVPDDLFGSVLAKYQPGMTMHMHGAMEMN